MDKRTDDGLSPYLTLSRGEWAALREDTPMTLAPDEVTRVRSLHDRLDMKEVEEIYLPLSRLLSMYVAAAQRLFFAQRRFLGIEDRKMPYIIGVAGSVVGGVIANLIGSGDIFELDFIGFVVAVAAAAGLLAVAERSAVGAGGRRGRLDR